MFWLLLCIILFVFVAFLSLTNRSFNKGKYIILIVCIGIIAYHTIPLQTDDLFRYNAEMERLSNNSLKWAMENGTWKTTTFSNIILFLFAKYNVEQFLPVITATILIALFSFIIYKEIKKHDEYNAFSLLLAEFAFGAFLDIYLVMNIVRNTFAMAFFVIVVYLDYHKKIKIPLLKFLLYALLPLFHSSMLPIVLIVFFSKIKIPSKLKFLAIMLSPFFVQGFTNLFGSINLEFFDVFSQKSENYMGEFTMGESLGLTLITLAMAVLVMVILFGNLRNLKSKDIQKDNELECSYIELLLSLTMAMFSMFFVSQALLFRLFPAIILLSSPYIYRFIITKTYGSDMKLVVCGMLFLCASARWVFQYINYFSIWQLEI